jgi:hypothetical protein
MVDFSTVSAILIWEIRAIVESIRDAVAKRKDVMLSNIISGNRTEKSMFNITRSPRAISMLKVRFPNSAAKTAEITTITRALRVINLPISSRRGATKIRIINAIKRMRLFRRRFFLVSLD